MVCGPVCGISRGGEVREDEEEESWRPKLRTPGRQLSPTNTPCFEGRRLCPFQGSPAITHLQLQQGYCLQWEWSWWGAYQVSVPPGSCRALGLVPVQGEAEALFLRDVQHKAHMVAISRHVEPGQGCAGGTETSLTFSAHGSLGHTHLLTLWSFLQTPETRSPLEGRTSISILDQTWAVAQDGAQVGPTMWP